MKLYGYRQRSNMFVVINKNAQTTFLLMQKEVQFTTIYSQPLS